MAELTEVQAKALDYAEKTPAGKLSMFTPLQVVSALEAAKLVRRGKLTKAGRAALSRYRADAQDSTQGETP